MSAFVVEDLTINRVVTWLHFQASHGRYPYDGCARPLLELGYKLKSDLGCKRLAEEMFTLNCDAVEQRYSDSKASDFRDLDFDFETVPFPGKPLSILKALQCWLYQCMEGNVPETSPLYKAMREVEAHIALDYISTLKEYDEAKWG